jgi:hypothetical protein
MAKAVACTILTCSWVAAQAAPADASETTSRLLLARRQLAAATGPLISVTERSLCHKGSTTYDWVSHWDSDCSNKLNAGDSTLDGASKKCIDEGDGCLGVVLNVGCPSWQCPFSYQLCSADGHIGDSWYGRAVYEKRANPCETQEKAKPPSEAAAAQAPRSAQEFLGAAPPSSVAQATVDLGQQSSPSQVQAMSTTPQ